MALTHGEQQFVLDILAEVCGKQLGVELTFTLKEEEQERPEIRPREA